MDYRTLKMTYDTRKWLERKKIKTVEQLTSMTFGEFMSAASYLGEERIIEIIGKLAFNDLYKRYIGDYYALKAEKAKHDRRQVRCQNC